MARFPRPFGFPSAALVAIALAAIIGCDRSAAPGGRPVEEGLRIVSLSPALSRTLVDFGLDSRVVGRTPYCDAIDSSVPVVGDLYDLDFERLVGLRPTHVLVQPPVTGVDAELARLADEGRFSLVAWRLDTIDDIRRVLRELPEALYGDDDDELAPARARAVEIDAALTRALTPDGGGRFDGRVLLVYSLDPVGVFGGGTYLDEVLTRLGATNATPAAGWAVLSMEDVIRLDPTAIVVVRPGGDVESPAAAGGPIGDLDIEAVRSGRVAVLAHDDALLPSTGLIGAAGELDAILRRFADPVGAPDGTAP